MRAIAKFSQEGEARRFSFFLKREGIANELDIDGDTFSLWVEDEDQIFRAQKFLEEWREGKLLLPDISKEEAPQEEKSLGEEEFIDSESEKEALTTEEKIFEEEEGPESTFRKPLLFPFFLTGFFFFLCSFLFFLNWFQEVDWQNPSKGVYLLTPIQNACFYDAPKALEPSARYLMEHPVLPQDSIQSFPLDIQKALMEFASPPWKGLDQYIIEKWHSPQKTIPLEMPRFEKIVEGEVWRLISPLFSPREFSSHSFQYHLALGFRQAN